MPEGHRRYVGATHRIRLERSVVVDGRRQLFGLELVPKYLDSEHVDAEHVDTVDSEHVDTVDAEHVDTEHVDAEHDAAELVEAEHVDTELVDAEHDAWIDGRLEWIERIEFGRVERIDEALARSHTVRVHSAFSSRGALVHAHDLAVSRLVVAVDSPNGGTSPRTSGDHTCVS